MSERVSPAGRVIWSSVVVLAVLHCDFWWWDDATLLFGFLPIGLASQAVISLLAAALWFAAIRFAWPEWIEQWADEYSGDDAGEGSR